MRIAGGLLALLFGLALVLWKGAVLVVLAALGLVREGVESANLSEADLRRAIDQLRQAEVPIPPTLESWLMDWLREHLLTGGDAGLGPVWLGLGLAILVTVVALVVLFGRSRVAAILLALAGGAGFYVGLELSGDGWFSLSCFAIATIGGLMAAADSGRKGPQQQAHAGQSRQGPPPPPSSGRPPPPPPPPPRR
jgi:hypothetical protein